MTTSVDPPVVFDLRLPDLTLDHGQRVRSLVVRGWMWAPDARGFVERRGLSVVDAQPARVVRKSSEASVAEVVADVGEWPTVVIVHALTGDSIAGGDGGWWSPVIGPGRAIDPTTHRVVCFNNLGSCYGTSGPSDEGFPAGPINTWDQARCTLRALDALGIERVALVTGGSLGGMVTLSIAALAPDRVARIAPVASCAAASAWIIGFNHVQRTAISLTDDPAGLALARQIAMLTYRAEPGLDERQGRQLAPDGADRPYRMQTYLDYQGHKLVDRFERGTYLAMMDAMDHHDLSRPPRRRDAGETWAWDDGRPGLARILASCLAIGIDTDQLFFAAHSAAIARELEARGVVADVATIHSPHGHDAFLIEWNQLDVFLRRALALPPGAQS